MKILPFNPDTLQEAVSILKQGGVVAHPIDTCYGLAGDLMNETAFRKIQAIKGRNLQKPMSVMISVPEQLHIKKYVKLDEFSSFVTFKLFPSPITILLPKGPAIPDFYFPETPMIGLRVPLHDGTQDLLRAFGGPLITTSANPSGGGLCFKHQEVIEAFKRQPVQPDLVFEGQVINNDKASTIIAIEKDHIRIVRPGPITASQLQMILGVPVKE
jgi:L-threonylcarbamoyladenylate synthase